MIRQLSIQEIKNSVIKKHYAYTGSNKPYDPFLFGVRSKDLTIVDHFNDAIGMIYFDDKGSEHILQLAATTKPGLFYLKNQFGNHKDRTGILCEGQYIRTWCSRMPQSNVFPPQPTNQKFIHNGLMYSLGQMGGEIRYYQDYSLDGKFQLNPTTITHGYVGCNIHSTNAAYHRDQVWNWSSLCQVVFDYMAFENQFMFVIDKAWDFNRSWMFSYTLFNESDF